MVEEYEVNGGTANKNNPNRTKKGQPSIASWIVECTWILPSCGSIIRKIPPQR